MATDTASDWLSSEEPIIADPFTGEVIPADDADKLIDCLEKVKALDSRLYLAKQELSKALAALCKADGKTQRVMGERRRVKVEAPEVGWDQQRLRNIWETTPEKIRSQVLSIAELNVRKRALDMMLRTTGPEEFEEFKLAVQGACKGPCGSPRVTIEV